MKVIVIQRFECNKESGSGRLVVVRDIGFSIACSHGSDRIVK